MEEMEVTDADILLAQQIISASSRHDLKALKVLLKNGSANVRDPATGTTPLHAAVQACDPTSSTGDAAAAAAKSEDEAAEVMHLLLQNGAIWNDLNKDNETPGCVALRLDLDKLYQIMVDAGVRAELLFGKMEALGLGGDDDDEDEEEEVPRAGRSKKSKVDWEQPPADLDPADEKALYDDDVIFNNHAYLNSELRFRPGILLDSSDNAVMMDWENTIMKRHAETLLPTPGLRALNVGHGLGLVDTAIQERQPAEHHIIEAHPQVIARMKENGWDKRPGVRIWEGRWQDMLPKMAAEGVVLDAIYYDTFAEDYAALREFFSEYIIQVMDSKAKFGWYNGLGADRQLCYDVYTKVGVR